MLPSFLTNAIYFWLQKQPKKAFEIYKAAMKVDTEWTENSNWEKELRFEYFWRDRAISLLKEVKEAVQKNE